MTYRVYRDSVELLMMLGKARAKTRSEPLRAALYEAARRIRVLDTIIREAPEEKAEQMNALITRKV